MATNLTAGKTKGVTDELQQVPADLRASDRDRESTVDRLRRHVTEGTLTLDEFADRVGVALGARTRGELELVVSDLAPPDRGNADLVPASESPGAGRSKGRRWLVAVMSGGGAKGRWRVGKSVTALAIMGGCEVDFRQAQIEAGEVRVTAVAIMGGIDIVVPEGIAVELTGLPIMGGKNLKIAPVPVLPGSPVISVRAFPIMGGISVRSKPNSGERGQRRKDRPEPKRHAAPLELPDIPKVVSTPPAAGVDRSPQGTVTIMFSDIVGYSAMTERLGDLAAHELLRTHNSIVRDELATHSGQEIKSQGDGFMVAFQSAAQALRCAIAIQARFEKFSSEQPDAPIRVRLGLHTGEPIRDGGDLLGRTVITASRLSDLAGSGEILVSSLLHELTDPMGEFRFGQPRQVELKGITGLKTVYPLDWKQ